MKNEITLRSIDDWNLIFENIKKYLKPKTIFLLNGDLGAGKTTFVSAVCQNLQIPLSASPTYAIIHEYGNTQNLKIIHVDLYRLESADEITSSGFWDVFSRQDAVVFVEWPTRVDQQDWPLDWRQIEINIEKNDHQRTVVISVLN